MMDMEENNVQPVSISVKKHIVIFGKHEYILRNVQTLLDKADFTSEGFVQLPEILDYIKMNPLDAVLIGGGVDPHDRLKVQDLIRSHFPHVKVVEHYGGPATIIPELHQALR
ncbi:MAG: hypothetical protein K1X54_05885 [Flavobacteriales bacterium]|nr:hypothetical protein [Flavobacteriales bacterium]